MRLNSIEASKLFKDNSLNFAYIDGAHYYEAVKQDLKCWYPKIAGGGMLLGDDYVKDKKRNFGVIKAVNEFTKINGFDLKIYEDGQWIIFKC